MLEGWGFECVCVCGGGGCGGIWDHNPKSFKFFTMSIFLVAERREDLLQDLNDSSFSFGMK